MKKLVFLSSLVLAASVAAAPLAFAQERKPVAVGVGKACGTVTLTFTNPAATVHGFRWNAVAGKVATADGARTGLVTVGSHATVKETIRFDEDEFNGEAAVTVAVAFGPDSDIQPRIPDIYPVDTDCAPPAPTPSPALPTPPPAPTPPVTPSQPPPPAPAPVDLDCNDFPLADGRTAQGVLNADPTDPHHLDLDGDKLACEIDQSVGNGSNAGGDFSQVGELPSAIDTGRA